MRFLFCCLPQRFRPPATLQFLTQSVQAQLSGIREAAGAQNYENAAHQIDALLEYYETRQHLLEFFIRRETVTSASVSLHGLSAYANGETTQDLFSEIDKASEQIHAMEHLFFSIF